MRQAGLTLLLFAFCRLVSAQQTPTPPNSTSAPPLPAYRTQTFSTAPQTVSSSPQLPQPHTLLDGTPIKLRLSQTISSADATIGQEIPFEVVEEVKVDNLIVLAKGATAIANVTDAEHKRRMGRGGKLDITISYARLADQEKVALRAVKDTKGGGHVGAMTGAIVATSIVFFPAAPLFLFMHGKDISIPQGTEITAFVEGDMHLDMTRFGVAPPATATADAAAPAQSSITIESAPPGADIEIDGAFVGNTPSTVTVAPGSHQIAVKKKGFIDWAKTLSVTGGSIHLNAELEQAPAQQ
jgi:hypothetical protein